MDFTLCYQFKTQTYAIYNAQLILVTGYLDVAWVLQSWVSVSALVLQSSMAALVLFCCVLQQKILVRSTAMLAKYKSHSTALIPSKLCALMYLRITVANTPIDVIVTIDDFVQDLH